MADARPHRLRRLDALDAGRAPDRAARPSARSPQSFARSRARAEIERAVGKAGVLDRYLTLAPFGGNLEGVRAASLAYFGKEPLEAHHRRGGAARRAAAVARGAPAGPLSGRRARRPRPRARPRRRARRHQRRRRRGGEARAGPRGAKGLPGARRPRRRGGGRRRPEGEGHPALDRRAAAGEARDARRRRASRGSGRNCRRRSSSIDNASGEIRARVGAADRDDASRDGAIDMSRAPRSPGSALKPFIYALAFEEGLAHPETVLFDRPARYGAYAPENFDLGYQGTVTARKALQMSLNLPAIELLADVGPATFLARLHGAGAEIALPKDTPIGLAIGLGGLGHFAHRRRAPLRGLRARRRSAGVDRAARRRRADHRRRAASPIRSRPGTSPTSCAARRRRPMRCRGRIAFKTGTSYGFRDALAVGFDRGTTIAVWVGRPDNGPTPGLIGRQAAAPILFDAFERLGRDVEIIKPPKGVLTAAHHRRPAAAAAPSAQGRAEDHGRDRDGGAEDRLSAGRRADRPRHRRRRARRAARAEGARRRPAVRLVRQRRAGRRGGAPPQSPPGSPTARALPA